MPLKNACGGIESQSAFTRVTDSEYGEESLNHLRQKLPRLRLGAPELAECDRNRASLCLRLAEIGIQQSFDFDERQWRFG